jgi:hypothetical protein
MVNYELTICSVLCSYNTPLHEGKFMQNTDTTTATLLNPIITNADDITNTYKSGRLE